MLVIQCFYFPDHTKLNGIETGATADQTASEIKALIVVLFRCHTLQLTQLQLLK